MNSKRLRKIISAALVLFIMTATVFADAAGAAGGSRDSGECGR